MAVQKTPEPSNDELAVIKLIHKYLSDDDIVHSDALQLAGALMRFYFGIIHLSRGEKAPDQLEMSHLILMPVTEMFNNRFYNSFHHEFESFRTQMATVFLIDDKPAYTELFGSMIAHIVFIAHGRNFGKSAEFHVELKEILK